MFYLFTVHWIVLFYIFYHFIINEYSICKFVLVFSNITNIYPRVLFTIGKKGKKNKGKTLALTEFLQEKTGTITSLPIRKSTSNWADEVEEFGKWYFFLVH